MLNRKNLYVSWVDAFKGIAICGVVMIHSGAGGLSSLVGTIGNAGKYGVQLFLLISAYLAYASLDRMFGIEYQTINFRTVIPWWRKKIIRIVPLYYLAIVSALAIEGTGARFWLGSYEKVDIWNIASHFLLLHGLNPYYVNSILGGEWYLAVLVVYYFLAPWLYKYANTLKRTCIIFGVVAVISYFLNNWAAGLSVIKDEYIWNDYVRTFWLPAQFPVLILGGMLYFLLKKLTKVEGKYNFAVSLIALASAVVILGCQLFEVSWIFKISRFVTWSIGFMLLIVSQVMKKSHVIDNFVFRKIGEISYPIYLFHLRFISLYERYIQKGQVYGMAMWSVKYTVVLTCSCIVSILLIKCYDVPIRRKLNC